MIHTLVHLGVQVSGTLNQREITTVGGMRWNKPLPVGVPGKPNPRKIHLELPHIDFGPICKK